MPGPSTLGYQRWIGRGACSPTLARRFPLGPGDAPPYPPAPPLPVLLEISNPDHLLSAVSGLYLFEYDVQVHRTVERHRHREQPGAVQRGRGDDQRAGLDERPDTREQLPGVVLRRDHDDVEEVLDPVERLDDLDPLLQARLGDPALQVTAGLHRDDAAAEVAHACTQPDRGARPDLEHAALVLRRDDREEEAAERGVVEDGADAVVPVEWTDGGAVDVRVDRPTRPGSFVRRRGEDVEEGATVLRPGARIGAGEMGVLAAVGCRSVPVRPRPRVVVLSTGEELVEPGRPLGPGQIYESNSYMIAAAARDEGCEVHRHGFVGDDPATVWETLEGLLVRADVVVTTGGVSMGVYDVVKEVLTRQGTVEFTQVAMQPGKPQGFGTIGPDRTPILTLPGNPVSAFVSFHLFVRPVLRRLRGLRPNPLPSVRARLTTPVGSPRGRRSYLRAVLAGPTAADEAPTVAPAVRQGSHQLSALADAKGLEDAVYFDLIPARQHDAIGHPLPKDGHGPARHRDRPTDADAAAQTDFGNRHPPESRGHFVL